jgi:hypothetical protein
MTCIQQLLTHFLLELLCLIGCATNAPDGSSPRGYGRVRVVDYKLINSSLLPYIYTPLLFLF